jgi:hypothetical protein
VNQALSRSAWLLVVCGVLEAVVGFANLKFAAESTVALQGNFVLAAGACVIAAGLGMLMKGRSWLLAMNGLATAHMG